MRATTAGATDYETQVEIMGHEGLVTQATTRGPTIKGPTDTWKERCERCDEEGRALACSFCNRIFHPTCIDGPTKQAGRLWTCPDCVREDSMASTDGTSRDAVLVVEAMPDAPLVSWPLEVWSIKTRTWECKAHLWIRRCGD